MKAIAMDLRWVLRQLRKSKGFTVLAVLTLALGIGATVAIFSLVYGVLLRPLPYKNPSQLYVLSDRLQGVPTGNSTGEVGVTASEIAAYKQNTHAFASLGAYQNLWPLQLAQGGTTKPLDTRRMDADMFSTLGVPPLMGRTFTRQEVEQGQNLVILSYQAWKNAFAGDPKILGKTISLSRVSYVVIGVMPRGFEFPMRQGYQMFGQIWIPLHLTPDDLKRPDWGGIRMIGRLKPGISAVQAQGDANRVEQATVHGYPAKMAALKISSVVRSLKDEFVASARPLIRILFFAVCVVLLIACVNLAGLLLVRAIRRRRETAVRLALGSGAWTLVRQSLLESLTLSFSGALLGIGLAVLVVHAMLAVHPDTTYVQFLPATMPRMNDIGVSWPVVAFAVFLALATGVLAALAPALAAIHTNMSAALKEGSRSSGAGGHGRLRSTLVVGEIAVAMLLLFLAGLLLRSYQNVANVDLGFTPEQVITGIYTLPKKKYKTQADVDNFRHSLEQKLADLPGVTSFGLTSYFPMQWGAVDAPGFMPFTVEGHVLPKGASVDRATAATIEGDYFGTMHIPLLRGRLFTDADNADSQLVVIVNRKLAQQYWPGQDPLGKHLRIGPAEAKTPWLTVVGVVADVKQGSADQPTSEQFYQPLTQWKASLGTMVPPTFLAGSQMSMLLRTPLSTAAMKLTLRKTVRSLDPQLALSEVETMDQAVQETRSQRQFITTLITIFACLAVLLAILGIYSVIAFSAAMRTHEMAIRMALGSSRGGVVRLVLTSAARLALIGCAIGLIGAVFVSHLLHAYLFQVGRFDPVTLIAAVVIVLGLSLAASYPPARRASSIAPMQALKSE